MSFPSPLNRLTGEGKETPKSRPPAHHKKEIVLNRDVGRDLDSDLDSDQIISALVRINSSRLISSQLNSVTSGSDVLFVSVGARGRGVEMWGG